MSLDNAENSVLVLWKIKLLLNEKQNSCVW
jgi:hypothetical protein